MGTKAAISQLKRNKNVTRISDKLNFNIFTTINRGDNFRINSRWKIVDLKTPTYIVTFTNSYRVNVVKCDLEYRPLNVAAHYMCCYIKLSKATPDTIIHPLNLCDRIMNLFFHQNIKLKDKPTFNKNYLLQSMDKEAIERLLSDELIHTIESHDELFLEIRHNICLIHYQRPPQESDGLILVEIAEKFDKIYSER